MTRDVAGELTACAICGCTEDAACSPNSCSWEIHSPPVCSACAEFLRNVNRLRVLLGVLRAAGIKRGAFELLAAIGCSWTRRKRRRRR